MTFEALYNLLLKRSVQDSAPLELNLLKQEGYDPHQLSCLLCPSDHALVFHTGNCDCAQEQKTACKNGCLFDALLIGENGNLEVNAQNCVGCADCVKNCKANKLAELRPQMDSETRLRRDSHPDLFHREAQPKKDLVHSPSLPKTLVIVGKLHRPRSLTNSLGNSRNSSALVR